MSAELCATLIAQYYGADTASRQRAFLHALPLARDVSLNGYFASWLWRQTKTLRNWASDRREYADAVKFIDVVETYFRTMAPPCDSYEPR